MARTPDGAEPRALTLHVRITPAGMRVLDRLRGQATRSAYVRALLAAESRRHVGSSGYQKKE